MYEPPVHFFKNSYQDYVDLLTTHSRKYTNVLETQHLISIIWGSKGFTHRTLCNLFVYTFLKL